MTYERLRHVLKDLTASDAQLPGRPLLDVAFGSRPPAIADAVPAWKRASDKQLDATQTAAVDLVLASRDIALIHGPPGVPLPWYLLRRQRPCHSEIDAFWPVAGSCMHASGSKHASHEVQRRRTHAGTGKTTAVVEAVLQEVARGNSVLCCSASNVAVDNVVERVSRAAPRTRIVRAGHPARLLPEVLDRSLEALVLRSDSSRLAADCRAEIKQLNRRLLKLGKRDCAERRKIRGELRKLGKEEKQRQHKAVGEVLQTARVVCCTLTGVHSHAVRNLRFDVAFIDEAAQALEVACWGAMLRARRAVLAGAQACLLSGFWSRTHACANELIRFAIQAIACKPATGSVSLWHQN